MRLQIKTKVEQDVNTVWEGFNEQLFLQLNPPFPKVALLRFDGSTTGDIVHLELDFLVYKSNWVSKIIDHGASESEIYFVDEGVELPGIFKFWKHRHRIVRDGNQSIIIDDITFKSPFVLMDWLLIPTLWLQFLYRKPVYKRFFSLK